MPAPTTISSAWPLSVAIAAAIDAAIEAEVAGFQLLDSPAVYSGIVPANTSLTSAYIALGNSQQVRAPGAFGRRGRENVETIDVWTADQSKATALTIADALVGILDGADLALAGYGTVRGVCEIVLTNSDPTTAQYRAQLRYTARSLNPA